MTAETLNFGPEWLRALSSGGSVTSPPPSPAMPKYKLAEYRYGREEMLALYIKDNKVPEDMQDKEFAAILQDEPMQPLALVPLTEEEQRNFSMSVNSVAVLRLMGKGAGGAAPAGVVRGRGATRGGRGRGRGEGGFYQRSIEDVEVGFGRSVREIHRSQSWDDRGERRFEKPLRREVVRPGFEEAAGPGGPGRKEYTRADSDNWRTLREEQEEDEGEPGSNWRLAGPRRDDGGPRSAGWRDHGAPGESRRRKFDFDFRDSEGHGGGRRRAGSEGLEDDRDGLPEWCTDEEDGEMGTFDSSGAFMPMKKSGKETILEEELEFKGIEEEEEEESFADIERNSADGDKDKESKDTSSAVVDGEAKPASPSSSPPTHCTPPCLEPQPSNAGPVVDSAHLSNSLPVKANSTPSEDMAPTGGSKSQLSPSAATSSSLPPPPPSSTASLLPPSGGDIEDDEGMKHLQQEAEKMVASLQDTSLEEECFTQALQQQQESRNTAAALPLSHEAAMKWFYKDPQGEIQGPFTTVEMCEWFQAGYFTMTLLVKRGCDEGFQPLGDVIKMWGRVPFAPGPSPPPLLVRQPPPTQRPQPNRGPAGTVSQSSANVEDGEGRMQRRGKIDRQVMGNLDQERLKKQQELAAAAALYQQLQQQQLFQLINRCSEQGMMPSMNRSMSVPDTGSMWDMHTSASQPSGGEASLWDITMNPSTQGPTLEQLQKLQQERRDAELRAKREEEEQRKRREEKRRQQEEQKRREEEELFRRKQCRQQQELIMKLLQQAPQQQGPGAGGSGWSGGPSSGLTKAGKSSALALMEMQQEAERLLKQQQQQRAQQQRDRHPGMSMGSSSMGGQWVEGVGMWGGPGGMEGKSGSGGSSGSMGMWDEAVKNQASLRGNSNNMGLKNSRSSPSLSDQYMMRRKRTEEEEKLLKLLQGMKPQDGFTTWCEQMLHALNTSANNSSSSLDVATIVAYLKEVESPYAVLDFIRSYLGDTVEAKEFAKQFLERRAKQKANQQRQQQQLSKEVAGLNMNFPLQDSMRGMNPSTLQSMFQANHMGKAGLYDNQGGKMKKKQPMMLHSDPSILGYSFHNTGECLSLNEMEMVEDY
ncbi:GRB10-interacting GYF protein 1 isoform X1 [Seriola aureovittata]|uniref:GRB10-interacting GYF protein 1 isoform X1 n=1 Tax=Seriola aureovittata TaxID=2871759 RepID=UPI0024BD9E72|nr:GRB10-interacting GYF protein 1 isoform X1 [Seriola aureovittata]XP_056225095.1 GRB10-interacting GYF protein 1 isoform X1 [Seriola aureovittata]